MKSASSVTVGPNFLKDVGMQNIIKRKGRKQKETNFILLDIHSIHCFHWYLFMFWFLFFIFFIIVVTAAATAAGGVVIVMMRKIKEKSILDLSTAGSTRITSGVKVPGHLLANGLQDSGPGLSPVKLLKQYF